MTTDNPNVLVIQMGNKTKEQPAWDQTLFQNKAEPVEALQTESFYVASKGEAVVGLVSDTENDRPVVAALVANWIASGLSVTQVNRKDMLRKLRIIVKKEDAILNGDVAAESQEVAPAVAAAPAEVAPVVAAVVAAAPVAVAAAVEAPVVTPSVDIVAAADDLGFTAPAGGNPDDEDAF